MVQGQEDSLDAYQYLYAKLNALWQIIISRKQAIGATCIDEGLQKLLIKSSTRTNANVVVAAA